MTKTSNLFPANKFSAANQLQTNDTKTHRGIIKLRLAHSEGKSYIIPEILIGLSGTRYFIPSFFGPPVIALNIKPNYHEAQFSIDVGDPKSKTPLRLIVKITSDSIIKKYADGAQIHECTFEGPKKIYKSASGTCRQMENGDFAIRAFHHTTIKNKQSIQASNELWSSSWNLAGTRELKNVAYTYFTSLPKIKSEEDLHRVAMASDGIINFQTTSNRTLEEVLALTVYRDNTNERTAALPFFIPTEYISPWHLFFHDSAQGQPAYYECVRSEIIRVGVNPEAKLHLDGDFVSVKKNELKSFSYIIEGNASEIDGIEAPYKEEETKCIAHLEKLSSKNNAFKFWLENSNTNLVSSKKISPKILKSKS